MKLFRKRSFPRKSIPWLRTSGWGTIYLLQSREDPRLFKVGYTRRRTKDRRAELRAKVYGELDIVYGLSMPHAYQAEQRVLRGLRSRWFASGDRRGSEWFWLRRNECIDDIKLRILRAANQIRREAFFRGSWKAGHQYQIYEKIEANACTNI